MRQIDKIIIHCSATPTDMDITASDIRDWHIDRGWSDIGYHYVIRRDGTLEDGRPIEQAGAHTKGRNTNSIGICLIGGADSFDYTLDQMDVLVDLVETLEETYPNATVHGHNEFSGKACPQFDVQAFFTED
ncbi:MAG: N-acetylmuramoyl-L-alanine amidase [Flavobacteriales bacterium]|nr:N-acetylmuramoyl-L-alanine amidase [Flavobacteriales bacterium]